MYNIEFTYEAEADLKWFSRREQNIILDGIKSNLIYEPNVITTNRHPCSNDKAMLANWELRIGVYRVFYDIEESVQIVSIERIGKKPNNMVRQKSLVPALVPSTMGNTDKGGPNFSGHLYGLLARSKAGMNMNWTYRVFHDKEGYCIRVVYYEQDGTLLTYQEAPAVPTGRTPEELAQDIQWFQEAFELPILTREELDAELATQPPKPKKEKGQRKTLDQIMAELELEAPQTTSLESPTLEVVE